MTSITTKVVTELDRIVPKIKQATKQATFDVTIDILTDMNLYVPEDTGDLKKSALSASDFYEGKIVWATDYAERVFTGTHLNFRLIKNPRAQAFWSVKAEAVHGEKWVKKAQEAVERRL